MPEDMHNKQKTPKYSEMDKTKEYGNLVKYLTAMLDDDDLAYKEEPEQELSEEVEEVDDVEEMNEMNEMAESEEEEEEDDERRKYIKRYLGIS